MVVKTWGCGTLLVCGGWRPMIPLNNYSDRITTYNTKPKCQKKPRTIHKHFHTYKSHADCFYEIIQGN